MLNTKSKTCEVFTEQGNKVFNYKEYLKYYSDFFNLSGLDFEKGVSILENIKKAQESFFMNGKNKTMALLWLFLLCIHKGGLFFYNQI